MWVFSFPSPNICFIKKQLNLFLKLLIRKKEELTLHSSSTVERSSLVNSTVAIALLTIILTMNDMHIYIHVTVLISHYRGSGEADRLSIYIITWFRSLVVDALCMLA